MHKLKTWVFALLPLLGVAGCSGPGGKGDEQTPQQSALAEVADMLRATAQSGGKGPAKVSDFNGLQSLYPRGYEAVKSGEVVVIWGSKVKGEDETAEGSEIVAYEKAAPTQGGFVLLSSGEVKRMTADEFKSAAKAK